MLDLQSKFPSLVWERKIQLARQTRQTQELLSVLSEHRTISPLFSSLRRRFPLSLVTVSISGVISGCDNLSFQGRAVLKIQLFVCLSLC